MCSEKRKTKRRKEKKIDLHYMHLCKPISGVDTTSNRRDLFSTLRDQVTKGGGKPRKTVSVCLPLFENKSTNEKHALKVLFDSGSEGNIAFFTKKQMKGLPFNIVNRAYPVTWGTSNGTFDTTLLAKLKLLLPEFSQSKIFECEADVKIVKDGDVTYDLIVGIETMAQWNAVLDFGKQEMTIDEQTISMRHPDALSKKRNLLNTYRQATEPLSTKEETERVTKILDAKYEKADLPKIVEENCSHLTDDQQRDLLALLEKHTPMFAGKLGQWKGEEVHFELEEGQTPWQGRPYPVPRVHEQTLRNEVQRLVDIDVIEPITGEQSGGWGAPSFIIAKPNGQVRFLTDFRQVNKRIKRQPFPLPKISETLQRMEGFQWASAIDLNMGYYHLTLDLATREICSLIFPWGRYRYKRLPMGASTAPDVFQEKMNNLFNELEFVKVYIDDLLVISAGSFDDHLEKLGQVLQRLHEKGFQVNAAKSSFCALEVDYLGYTLTRDGIMPQKKKVAAILALKPPKNIKELRRVLGIVQFYRDIWEKRTDLLAPLTDLVAECGVSKNKKHKKPKPWRWDEEHEAAFQKIKKIIARDVVLAYPDYSKKFVIYTDASTRQLGGCITQDNRPIAFFSRKLTKAQEKYTVTELELLSIVETLKEFKGMLLGYEIQVMTDHINLTSKNLGLDSDRVLRWRLLLNEFDVKIDYIKGEDNTVADAISRLDYCPKENPHPEDIDAFDAKELNWHRRWNDSVILLVDSLNDEEEEVAEEGSTVLGNFAQDIFVQHEAEDTDEIFPVTIREVADAQRVDKSLKKFFDEPSSAKHMKPVLLQGETVLCFVRDPKRPRMIVPKKLQRKTIAWYHHYLQHPGRDKLEKTLSAVMYWKGMSKDIEKFTKHCKWCQLGKRRKRKYAELPPKQAVITPWQQVCVDLIGPYTVTGKDKTCVEFMCMTMIDPATGWFEVVELPTVVVYREYKKDREIKYVEDEILDRTSACISQLFNKTWLSRYPRPAEVVCDNGSEFKKDFAALLESFSIKRKPTTIKNPQANAILERVHGVLGDMMRTSNINNLDTVDENLIDEFLTDAAWAIRSTHHSVLRASPGQCIFGRDMLFDIPGISL